MYEINAQLWTKLTPSVKSRPTQFSKFKDCYTLAKEWFTVYVVISSNFRMDFIYLLFFIIHLFYFIQNQIIYFYPFYCLLCKLLKFRIFIVDIEFQFRFIS